MIIQLIIKIDYLLCFINKSKQMYTSHNRENKYYSSQGCKSEFGEAWGLYDISRYGSKKNRSRTRIWINLKKINTYNCKKKKIILEKKHLLIYKKNTSSGSANWINQNKSWSIWYDMDLQPWYFIIKENPILTQINCKYIFLFLIKMSTLVTLQNIYN